MNSFISFAKQNQVPYHNDGWDTYFLGNGIIGASATPVGEWNFLIGPDYTCPNYLGSEKLYLIVDEEAIPLEFSMHRIRKSGVFFGHTVVNDINVYVWDFAPWDLTLAVRYLCTDAEKNVKIGAKITSFESADTVTEQSVYIKKDTTRYCFGNRETMNWADRYCSIYFNSESSCVQKEGAYWLTTTFEHGEATLLHRLSYDAPMQVHVDAPQLLTETFTYWEKWLDKGFTPKIQSQRDADAIEDLLLAVKMQQNRDGGLIAGIRKYANSYIRDSHGAARMLLAAHHYEEVAKILWNIHTCHEKAGFIPNWWSMGSDTFIGHSFHNDASEITAYYMFMARDYLNCTKNTDLITKIMPSLKWAAEAQLDWLRNHDFTFDFNGDETEQYCCNNDGEEYGGFIHPDYKWEHSALSFPSMAAALCSLEWYSELTSVDLSKDTALLRKKIDEVFLKENGIHAWSAKITPNGIHHHNGTLTNYLLLPLWVGANLHSDRQIDDAAATKHFVAENGYLPNCVEIMPGFCGHTMGLYLYCMLMMGDKDEAKRAARQILDSNLLSMYGTVSEFYGPSGVPNGHMCRPFEGGILGEALIKYFAMTSE